MKKRLTNSHGFTLIELLAVIVLASLVMILVWNVMLFIQKQYSQQTGQIDHLYDSTLALNVITKDIRNADAEDVKISPDHTEITLDGTTYTFDKNNHVIKKNESVLVYGIDDFYVQSNDNEGIRVNITNSSGKKISTEITIRR